MTVGPPRRRAARGIAMIAPAAAVPSSGIEPCQFGSNIGNLPAIKNLATRFGLCKHMLGVDKDMLFLSKRERAEAKSRSLDYAAYFIRMYGIEAEMQVKTRLARTGLTPFRKRLLRLTLVELAILRRREAQASIPEKRATRG